MKNIKYITKSRLFLNSLQSYRLLLFKKSQQKSPNQKNILSHQPRKNEMFFKQMSKIQGVQWRQIVQL